MGSTLCCVCECPGPQTGRVTAHLHPTSTSLAAPRFPLTCAPPGQAVGRCVFSAAQPGPLRRHRRDKGRGGLVPARSGLPVYGGEGGGGRLRSSAVRFTSARNLPKGCWCPGARSPDQPGEGEGRGQSCCGRRKQQVRKVCNLATPAGKQHEGGAWELLPRTPTERGAFNFTPRATGAAERFQERFSLEATRKKARQPERATRRQVVHSVGGGAGINQTRFL